MKKEIKISIIVPIYNCEKYIVRCLDSLLAQNISNYEIILVNDGSIDKSQSIIDTYIKKYENKIFSYEKKNGGAASARNFGVKKAIGEYIMFVDSDDYIKKNVLNTLVKDRNEDIIVYNNVDIFEHKSGEYNNIIHDDIGEVKTGVDFYSYRIANQKFSVVPWLQIYKRKLIVSNNLFFKEGIFYEDNEWTPRVFIKAKSVIALDETIYYYLANRKSSLMNIKMNYKNYVDRIENIRSVYDYFQKNNVRWENYPNIYDNLINMYLNDLSNFYDIKTFKYYKKNVNYKFAKENIYQKKTKIKYTIFRINIFLYKILKKMLIIKKMLKITRVEDEDDSI